MVVVQSHGKMVMMDMNLKAFQMEKWKLLV